MYSFTPPPLIIRESVEKVTPFLPKDIFDDQKLDEPSAPNSEKPVEANDQGLITSHSTPDAVKRKLAFNETEKENVELEVDADTTVDTAIKELTNTIAHVDTPRP